MTNNDHLVLIGGMSAGGKSASLRNIANPEGVWYCNCEAGKRLPFPAKFKQFTITDPLQIFDAFDAAEGKPEVHTLIIDSLTYLMEMYESVYIVGSSNGMQAWQDYQQYFKKLMQQYVAKSTKNVIFTAHILNIMNDVDMVLETKVPVKGALKNMGIESYFSTVVTARKIEVNKLSEQESPHLNITEEEQALGFKYVFQTRLTKETVHSRIRSSMGMWTPKETFIDNDAQILIDRLHQYYS